MAAAVCKKSDIRNGSTERMEVARLAELGKLAVTDIETRLIADVSRNLHTLFDPVSDGALPIYFGPLLGRLYLEGL